MQDKQSDAYI